jgi:hypothetical protein
MPCRAPPHAARNLELAGVPRSTAMAMVGHKTESIYKRYSIQDAGMLAAGAAKRNSLHSVQEEQAQRWRASSRRM